MGPLSRRSRVQFLSVLTQLTEWLRLAGKEGENSSFSSERFHDPTPVHNESWVLPQVICLLLANQFKVRSLESLSKATFTQQKISGCPYFVRHWGKVCVCARVWEAARFQAEHLVLESALTSFMLPLSVSAIIFDRWTNCFHMYLSSWEHLRQYYCSLVQIHRICSVFHLKVKHKVRLFLPFSS